MKTTIEIPDELFKQAKSEAARRGQALKELITGAVAREVRGPKPISKKEISAIWNELRRVANANSKAWKGQPDAVAAIREQRR